MLLPSSICMYNSAVAEKKIKRENDFVADVLITYGILYMYKCIRKHYE